MKTISLILAALVAITLAQDDNVFLPFDPFQDDSQLGQLTEFEQEDAESLPQQQQQEQEEQQEQQQSNDDDEEFGAFREEPDLEQLNVATEEEQEEQAEPQLEQLNVENRQAITEPKKEQLKKKDEYKKSKSSGSSGISGFGTPVDLKHEKEIKIKAHPKFKYHYQVHDKKTKDIKEKKEERNGHKLKGEYKLLQPDHLWRHVKYSSDKKQGWVAHVSYHKG